MSAEARSWRNIAISTAVLAAIVVIVAALSAPSAVKASPPKTITEVVTKTAYVSEPECLRFVKKADRLVSLSLLADDVQLKALNATEEADLSKLVNLTEKLSAYSTLQIETSDAYLGARENCLDT